MKYFSLLFVALFCETCLHAQVLVGDWNVEDLSSEVGGIVGILGDEEFEAGVRFSADGKFYGGKVEKGTYKQYGDTIILTRKQEDVQKCKEEKLEIEKNMGMDDDENELNKYILEYIRPYTTDTLIFDKNNSGNTLLLLRVSAKLEVKPPYEKVFYLHKKGTNESLNKEYDIHGKWILKAERGITMDFHKDGKTATINGEDVEYTLDGEYITLDGRKTRLVVGKKFAAWQIDEHLKGVTELYR